MAFFVALGLALLLTPAARRAGLAVGMVDKPGADGLKIHAAPIPILGGAAVLAAALSAPALLGDTLPGSVVAAVLVGFVPGFVDDVRPLPPWPRILMQAGAGVVLAAGGAQLGFGGVAGYLGVVCLAVVLTNAVNMLDGQDGLAGGTAAIGALGLGGLAALDGSPTGSVAFAAAGGLAGFLLWNRPPARIFLGNGGAYAVGMLLTAGAAYVSMKGWPETIAAGLCLFVPLFEFMFTAGRRMATGQSLGAGDRTHSYDLLSRRTTRGAATAAICAAAGVGVGAAFGVRALPVAAGAALLALAGAAATLWSVRLWTRHPQTMGTG
jgi:UDP-GlcNAc:undecaprenyl-phosphate GlcNAc-1-phosphate transferase